MFPNKIHKEKDRFYFEDNDKIVRKLRGSDINFNIRMNLTKKISGGEISLSLLNMDDVNLTCYTDYRGYKHELSKDDLRLTTSSIDFTINGNDSIKFRPGVMTIEISVKNGEVTRTVISDATIMVLPDIEFKNKHCKHYGWNHRHK